MQLSKIVGSKVYSLFDCVEVGYVLGICFNKRLTKIENLVIANDDEETNYTLNTKNIYAVKDGCVMIKNLTKLSVTNTSPQSFINNTTLNIDGTVDKIADVELKNNFVIEKIVCQKTQFLPNEILFRNNNIWLVNNKDASIRRKNFRPRKRINTKSSLDKQVVLLENNITKPQTIVANNLNLIVGKKLFDNLVSKQNQMLAYKNSIITYHTLEIAKQFDVVDELLKLAK